MGRSVVENSCGIVVSACIILHIHVTNKRGRTGMGRN
jgi:hypothetical protein